MPIVIATNLSMPLSDLIRDMNIENGMNVKKKTIDRITN